ncbi:YIEGIA family protein [Desulfofalx alkaliphila]|uniref:YIEGIA family protein n=1 Tax=Desulfofalx alkaliphila TaxID=105483 RepID=UPI0004E1AF76|nr:YIEGIA family protein [Desulfofalx alkaliphila]
MEYQDYLLVVIIGTLMGTITRLVLLHVDYRQYPGYPHGYIVHLSLGFIASALGAVAVPAIVEKEFTAFTFLALAAQQFREIRHQERTTLESLEDSEIIQRGSDYIEGIARTFEARNYLVMASAFTTALATLIGLSSGAGVIPGLTIGILTLVTSWLYRKGRVIGDICDVKVAKIHFNGPTLMVENVGLINVGLKERRDKILKEGLAVMIHPKNDNARATIHDMGQRMVIAHTAGVVLGTKKDIDIPDYTPILRKDVDTGSVAMYMMPMERDAKALVEAVKRSPVLESAYSKPLATKAGRYASD